MSEGWSKLLDVGPLADGRAHIDFSIPLKEFPRVLPLLAASEGEARGRVDFSREDKIAVAQVTIAAEVTLLCQRCLAPLKWPVNSVGRAALVATAAEGERVPEQLETVLAPEHRISTRDLVEEELLLALPLVPRHEDDGCAGDRAAAEEVHRPFAQLSELFKRQ
ncbi:MAG: YceD family protein [Steroidobacteraceae bacterium]